MLDYAKTMLFYFENHYQDIVPWVVIMVSAIIVLIGLLKPLLFNRIKHKQVRKVARPISHVALCFICTFVVFYVKAWDMQYYLACAIALSVACIMTYWLYENTCLRNLIDLVGTIALRKLASVVIFAVNANDIAEIKSEAQKAVKELKAQTTKEIKQNVNAIKTDDDLKGL